MQSSMYVDYHQFLWVPPFTLNDTIYLFTHAWMAACFISDVWQMLSCFLPHVWPDSMPKGYRNAKHSPHLLCEETLQKCMVTTQHVKWDKKGGDKSYLETRIRSVHAITIGLPANNFLLDTFIVIAKNRKDKVILNIPDHSLTFPMCSRVLRQDMKPQKQRTIELLCHYYCEIYCVFWIISPHVIKGN